MEKSFSVTEGEGLGQHCSGVLLRAGAQGTTSEPAGAPHLPGSWRGGRGGNRPSFPSSCSTLSGQSNLPETPHSQPSAVPFQGIRDQNWTPLSALQASPPLFTLEHLRKVRSYGHNTQAEPRELEGNSSGPSGSGRTIDLLPSSLRVNDTLVTLECLLGASKGIHKGSLRMARLELNNCDGQHRSMGSMHFITKTKITATRAPCHNCIICKRTSYTRRCIF